MDNKAWAQEVAKKIKEKEIEVIKRSVNKVPYIAKNGVFDDLSETRLGWWTNGFWGGMMWQLYQATKEPIYKEVAENLEKKMDAVLLDSSVMDHDSGFRWLPTAVANYRLFGSKESRNRGMIAASNLAGRYNAKGEYIVAWNSRPGHQVDGWAIIDCMMNIPLLYWAGKEMEDPRFTDIANRHAETAMRVLLRPDGSCNHIGILDPETGEVLSLPGGQGYGEGSSWSRGQAWAVYGFALAFLHTGNQEFLDAAKRAAHYFLANVAMTGYVSLVDFRAPKEPVYWDTTATACAACGLLQIAEMVSEFEKDLYYKGAVKMLMALSEYHCDWNLKTDGILQNGTAAYWRDTDRHVSIIYGDYFYVEGILRLLGKEFMIW